MDRHPRVEGAIRNIEDLAKLLTDFPQQLFKKREVIFDTKRSLKSLTDRIKDRELEVAAVVMGAKVLPDGVALAFTNDTARKAETARRLKTDEDYQELVRRSDAIDANIEKLSLGLQQIEDERRAVEKIADLRHNQARLDIADMERQTALLRESVAQLDAQLEAAKPGDTNA